MKKLKIYTACMLILATVSTTAQTYHENDKEGLRIFLRQPSAQAGKINAEQLGLQISDTLNWQNDEVWVTKVVYLVWNEETPKRLTGIYNTGIIWGWGGWNYRNLAGTLDATKWLKLNRLFCSYNQLTILDISANLMLQKLDCSYNQLSTLDLSANTELQILYCPGNQLNSLVLNTNTKLLELDCSTNPLDVLDVSNNTELEILACGGNQLTVLDLSANINLKQLLCSNNPLTTLDLSANTELWWLECINTPLTSLNFCENTKLRELYCYDNKLNILALNTNRELQWLECYNNQLAALDLSANTELRNLKCYNNQLTALDLSANIELRSLECCNNQLTALDLSANTVLWRLECYNNQLATLILNDSSKLDYLICYNNQLLLSDLFAASQILENNEASMFWRLLGNQTLPTQVAILDIALDFPVPQNVFNGIYTQFSVIPSSGYSITNGKITFNKKGTYSVFMTNRAIISSSDSPAKIAFEVTVEDVGIPEFLQTLQIKVYPNPTMGQLTINSEQLTMNNIEIFDVMGRKIPLFPCSSVPASTVTMNISQLSAGIYFLRIDGETVKVVKQ